MFGQEGFAAIVNELKQLYDREVMEPVYPDDLSHIKRKKPFPI